MPAVTRWKGGRKKKPAGVGAERAVTQSSSERYAGAAAGTAGDMRDIPRVARRGKRSIDGGSAEGEFVHGQFAEEDRTGVGEFCDRGCVMVGNPFLEHGRMA